MFLANPWRNLIDNIRLNRETKSLSHDETTRFCNLQNEYNEQSSFPQKEMWCAWVHRLCGTEVHTPVGAASPFRSPCRGSLRELGWEEV